MPRFCTACGRALTSEEHDIARYADDHDKHPGEERRDVVVISRGRGRLGVRKQRRFGCRVRLTGTSPSSGRRLVPSSPQRDRWSGMASYRHVDRLREEH